MMGMGDNPVTLVVKAPNQRIEDQTIDCFLDWTVRKLKEHLEAVYPSNPKHNQQKLIYSGKLLPDDVTLKEVLRQFDEASLHTVHLVCSHGDYLSSDSSDMSSGGSVPCTPSGSSHSTVSSSSSADGLRFRGTNPVIHPNAQPNIYNPGATPVMPDPTNPMMAGFAAGNNMMPQPQVGYYTPEQYLWMQQMYSQYMTQYMQYYEHMNPSMSSIPAAPASAVTNDGPANQNRPANAAPANQNIRMNAQGGMVDDDDDEDVEHRDWLDYIFVSFRFLVLVSIIYFYSSLSRFVYVFAGFFVVYLLQNGWMLLRKRRAAAAEEQPAAAAAVPPDHVEQAEAAVEENTGETQAGDQTPAESENNTEVVEETANTPSSPPPVESPGVLAVFWCFVSTFFTSLVPQAPAGVNGN